MPRTAPRRAGLRGQHGAPARGRWLLPALLLGAPALALGTLGLLPGVSAPVTWSAASAQASAITTVQGDWFKDVVAAALPPVVAPAVPKAVAARRPAPPRATRSRVVAGRPPACAATISHRYANGQIPLSSLCPLWRAPGHRLRADAAAAFNLMSQYHASVLGTPLCVTDSYRSYGSQVSVYYRKRGLAARPGTSEHGWGLAVDFCGGIESAGSPAYRWMQANAGRFGFVHPAWAQPGGPRPEAWHWEFQG